MSTPTRTTPTIPTPTTPTTTFTASLCPGAPRKRSMPPKFDELDAKPTTCLDAAKVAAKGAAKGSSDTRRKRTVVCEKGGACCSLPVWAN
jgi:hypothetical protein